MVLDDSADRDAVAELLTRPRWDLPAAQRQPPRSNDRHRGTHDGRACQERV